MDDRERYLYAEKWYERGKSGASSFEELWGMMKEVQQEGRLRNRRWGYITYEQDGEEITQWGYMKPEGKFFSIIPKKKNEEDQWKAGEMFIRTDTAKIISYCGVA